MENLEAFTLYEHKNTINVTENIPGAFIPAPKYKSLVFT